ncbi:MAG TPA: hypothetical protein VFQ51_07405, partial [Vicinamibacteria bacterium]|nr:hypothetical protein [Vicinamibacteria bacterium]
MPDWSYRTVLRPGLFLLPPAAARDLAVGVMGPLGRSAMGRAVIDFLGHMRAPAVLRHSLAGLSFPSRAGLGCGLDPEIRACEAFARFGVGFVEVGPIALAARNGSRVARDDAQAGIVLGAPCEAIGLTAAVERLNGRRRDGVPVIARLEAGTSDEVARLVDALAPHVDAFTLDGGLETWTEGEWQRFYAAGAEAGSRTARPVFA